MKVGDLCRRGVISVDNSTDVTSAARRMREQHVGFLVVYRLGDPLRRPIGVLTDRDIVVEVIAAKVDPEELTIDDVMTREPLVANETDELNEVLQAMRLTGIRRVPVVDGREALVGVLAIDDALDTVTGLLCDITGSIKSELRHEWRARVG